MGQVAGYSDIAGNPASIHAFLSGANGGPLADLGTLGGLNSFGYGVNASGRVVGISDITGNAASHAFLSGANGGALADLGTLGGSTSYGYGVNASGQVVGYSDTTGNAAGHAFLYSGGVMIDLNDLIAPGSGLVLTTAQAISDTGLIVGYGTTATGSIHAFLLTPAVAAVPEPATVASMAVGVLAGLGVLARRRRRDA